MSTSKLPLGSSDVETYMKRRGIAGELVHCPAPTPTVEAAAQVMGVQPDQIVKSILFLVSGRPLLVIACGTGFIDRKPIADFYQVGRKQVKLADAETVLAVTGYPAGTVPPFAHLQSIETCIDPHVLAQPFVYAGGGEENALVRVDPRDLSANTHATPLAVLVEREAG